MARKQRALSFFSLTLTQGGADAFVQAQFSTALFGQTKTCFRLSTIEWEVPQRVVNAQNDIQLMLARKSYAAMPTSPMLEKAMIWAARFNSAFNTAAGFAFNQRIGFREWTDDNAPILVEDPLYAQLKTTATGNANTVYLRLGYWEDSINEVDKLTLVANSLS